MVKKRAAVPCRLAPPWRRAFLDRVRSRSRPPHTCLTRHQPQSSLRAQSEHERNTPGPRRMRCKSAASTCWRHILMLHGPSSPLACRRAARRTSRIPPPAVHAAQLVRLRVARRPPPSSRQREPPASSESAPVGRRGIRPPRSTRTVAAGIAPQPVPPTLRLRSTRAFAASWSCWQGRACGQRVAVEWCGAAYEAAVVAELDKRERLGSDWVMRAGANRVSRRTGRGSRSGVG